MRERTSLIFFLFTSVLFTLEVFTDNMATEQELLDLKTERTKLKQKVTTAAKRLNGSIERQSDRHCIDQFMIDLERSIADFCISHDEYCAAIGGNDTFAEHAIVNGMDLAAYSAQVQDVYSSSKGKYSEFIVTEKVTADNSAVKGVLKVLQCHIDRLKHATSALNVLLTSSAMNAEISCGLDDVTLLIDKL